MPAYFNTRKTINTFYYIKRIVVRNHVIFQDFQRKYFLKFSTYLLEKLINLNTTELTFIKEIYKYYIYLHTSWQCMNPFLTGSEKAVCALLLY